MDRALHSRPITAVSLANGRSRVVVVLQVDVSLRRNRILLTECLSPPSPKRKLLTPIGFVLSGAISDSLLSMMGAG